MLLDGVALAHALRVHPQSVRRWASKKKLQRRGVDRRGRALYDLDEAIAVAAGDTPGAARADDHPSAMVATPDRSSTTVSEGR